MTKGCGVADTEDYDLTEEHDSVVLLTNRDKQDLANERDGVVLVLTGTIVRLNK